MDEGFSVVDPQSVQQAGEKPERAIVCRACGSEITKRRFRMEIGGEHERVVFNPAGQVFRILTFSEAPGATAGGPASDEFTWFRGYSWRIASCRSCGSQLGWRYDGTGASGFWGLIAAALVLADEE